MRPKTSFEDITHYNNFYEFSTDKQGRGRQVRTFSNEKGWQVTVGGLVSKPRVFELDEIPENRPPRGAGLPNAVRGGVVNGCAVGWLPAVRSCSKPSSQEAKAKYVAFETLLDPARMPGQRSDVLKVAICGGLGGWMRRCSSAGDFGERTLWPGIAAAGRRHRFAWWCRGKYGFKGNQIHRENHPDGGAATNRLERIRAWRIWLLRPT